MPRRGKMAVEQGMHTELSRAQVVYQVALKVPLFDLPARTPESARAIYEVMSPRLPLRPSDIQVAPANNYGEFALSLSLFGGLGILEFRIDGYKAQFEGIRSQTDLQLVVDCIGDTELIANQILSSAETAKTEVSVAAWMKVEGGVERVHTILNQHSNLRLQSNVTRPADMILGGTLREGDERWGAKFLFEPSINKEVDHLFVKLDVTYWPESPYPTVDSRKTHIDSLLESLFRQVGFGDEEGSEG
jgi:hypothetical protein